MPSNCGLTLVKQFLYRGATEEYSNTYWFSEDAVSSDANWLTLANAVAELEEPIHPNPHPIIRAYGYTEPVAPGVTAAWTHEWLTSDYPGSLVETGGHHAAGDAAITCRWKTSRFNSAGKRIWLRKYFHGVLQSDTIHDRAIDAQLTALENLHDGLSDGSLPDSRRLTSMTQDEETIVASTQIPWITTRTLKRRGKRPGA